jgi:hypothetical protein
MNNSKAYEVVLQVTLYTCFQEMLGLICGLVADYPVTDFSQGFPHSLKENTGIVPQFSHD